MKLYFLHGFLGVPEDWKEVIGHLPSDWECEALDLTLPLPERFPEESALVGYSLGGRIALQQHHQGALVLLSAHFGLASEEEKKARGQEEKRILQEMEGCPETFLRKWYSKPLFSTLRMEGDLLKRRRSIDFAKHAALFSRYALSKQPFTPPPAHALLLYGERDEKYAKLYQPYETARAIPHAGHAVPIENPKATATFIQTYMERSYGNTDDRGELARSGRLR